MNQWAFVVAAYVLTLVTTAGIIAWAFSEMRRAEGDAEAAKRRK